MQRRPVAAFAVLALLTSLSTCRSAPFPSSSGPDSGVDADVAAGAGVEGPRLFLGTTPVAGTRIGYRFRWATVQEGTTVLEALGAPTPLGGRAELSGRMSLTVHPGEDGVLPIGLELSELSVGEWKLLGFDWSPGEPAADARAVVRLDARSGVVRDLSFAPQTGPKARALFRAWVSLAVFRTPGDGARAQWSVAERTALGVADTDYRRVDARTLHRRRTRYRSLDGVAALDASLQTIGSRSERRFDEAGVPAAIIERESIALRAPTGETTWTSDVTFVLVLEDERREPTSPSVAVADPEPLHESGLGALRRDVLLRRVDGLTEARLHDRITVAGAGGGPEGEARFLHRATGLLLLQPEIVERVKDRMLQPSAQADSDQLIVDLLTFAGSDSAQAALCRALEDPRVRARPYHHLLVQRLGLLAEPSAATAQFALRLAQEAAPKTDLAIGALYAVGALAGRLSRSVEPELAKPLLALLERRLSEAGDADERARALEAMGNAAFDAHAALVAAFAGAPEAAVRRAVAGAARGFLDSSTREALFGLVIDADGEVAELAVRSLGERPLSPEERRRLAGLVPRIPTGADAALLSLFRDQPGPSAEVLAALEVIRARRPHDPSFVALVQSLVFDLSEPRP